MPAQSPQAGVQTDVYSGGARAKRIDTRIAEVVNAGKKLITADIQNTQMDAGNELAAWLTPKLLNFSPGGSTDQALALLEGWNFQQPRDSAAAMYFNAVYSALVQRMFVRALGNDKSLSFNAGDRFREIIRVLWNAPNDPWWDDASTPVKQDRDTTVTNSLRAANDELTKSQGSNPTTWTWGSAHTLTVENPTLGKTGNSGPQFGFAFTRPSVQQGGTNTLALHGVGRWGRTDVGANAPLRCGHPAAR